LNVLHASSRIFLLVAADLRPADPASETLCVPFNSTTDRNVVATHDRELVLAGEVTECAVANTLAFLSTTVRAARRSGACRMSTCSLLAVSA
jgi:hypothetical protein